MSTKVIGLTTVHCEGADSDQYGGIARGRCRVLYFNKTFNGHHIFNLGDGTLARAVLVRYVQAAM